MKGNVVHVYVPLSEQKNNTSCSEELEIEEKPRVAENGLFVFMIEYINKGQH